MWTQVNVHALVDLIMPHYRKVHHKVSLTENKKEKHDHPLVWFYFSNPRTNIATPWRQINEHYKMVLQRENLAYSCFLKNRKVDYLVKTHDCKLEAHMKLLCHSSTDKVCASFEWLLFSQWLCCVVLKSFFLFKCLQFVLNFFFFLNQDQS